MQGSETVTIAAPVDAVWDLVSDVTRIGEFSPETFEAEWTGDSDGPAVGATFRGHVKRNQRGPTYWAPCVVTACVPNEHFEFGVGPSADKAINTWGYRLRPADGGTEVTEYFRLTQTVPTKLYWALLGRWRGRTNQRGMQATLQGMKRSLEN